MDHITEEEVVAFVLCHGHFPSSDNNREQGTVSGGCAKDSKEKFDKLQDDNTDNANKLPDDNSYSSAIKTSQKSHSNEGASPDIAKGERGSKNPFEEDIERKDNKGLSEVHHDLVSQSPNLHDDNTYSSSTVTSRESHNNEIVSRDNGKEEQSSTNPFDEEIEETNDTDLCEIPQSSKPNSQKDERLLEDLNKNITKNENPFHDTENITNPFDICEDERTPTTSTQPKHVDLAVIRGSELNARNSALMEFKPEAVQQPSPQCSDVTVVGQHSKLVNTVQNSRDVSRAHVTELICEAFNMPQSKLDQLKQETLRNKTHPKVAILLEDIRAQDLPVSLNKVNSPSNENSPFLFLRVKLGQEDQFHNFCYTNNIAAIERSLEMKVKNMYNDTLTLEIWTADKLPEEEPHTTTKLDIMGRLVTGSIRRKRDQLRNAKMTNQPTVSIKEDAVTENNVNDNTLRIDTMIHRPTDVENQSINLSSDTSFDMHNISEMSNDIILSSDTSFSNVTSQKLSTDASDCSTPKGTILNHKLAPVSNTEESTVTEKSLNISKMLRKSFRIKSSHTKSLKISRKIIPEIKISPSTENKVPEGNLTQSEKGDVPTHNNFDEDNADSNLSTSKSAADCESPEIAHTSSFSFKSSIRRSIKKSYKYVAKESGSPTYSPRSLMQSDNSDISFQESSHENESNTSIIYPGKIREPENPPDVQEYLSSMEKGFLQAELLAHTNINVKDIVGTWTHEAWFSLTIASKMVSETAQVKRKIKKGSSTGKNQQTHFGDENGNKLQRLHLQLSLLIPECDLKSLAYDTYTSVYRKLIDMQLKSVSQQEIYDGSVGVVGDIFLEQLLFFSRISEGYQKLTKWLVMLEKKSLDSIILYPLLEEVINRLRPEYSIRQGEMFVKSLSTWVQQVITTEFENLHAAFPGISELSHLSRLEHFLKCFRIITTEELEKDFGKGAAFLSLSSVTDQLKKALVKHAEKWIEALKIEAANINTTQKEKESATADINQEDVTKKDISQEDKETEDNDINHVRKEAANHANGLANRGSANRSSVLRKIRQAIPANTARLSSFLYELKLTAGSINETTFKTLHVDTEIAKQDSTWHLDLKRIASLTTAITDFLYISTQTYQPIFILEMSVDYLQWIMPQFLEATLHVLGKMHIVEPSTLHSLFDNDISSAVQASWKICSNVNEINKIIKDIKLPADVITQEYQAAFSTSVLQWLTLSKTLSLKEIENDIQRDTFEAVDSDKGISHSALSMADVLRVIMSQLEKMLWPGGVRPGSRILSKIARQILIFTREYMEITIQTYNANGSKPDVIPSQVCVAVCNVGHVCDEAKEHFSKLTAWAKERLDGQKELPTDDDVESLELDCEKYSKELQNYTNHTAKALLQKCLPGLEDLLKQCWKCDSSDSMIKALEVAIQPVEEILYFARPILIALWERLFLCAKGLKVKYSKIIGWQEMKNLQKILTAVYSFLTDNEGVGCQLSVDAIQDYENLLDDLMILGTSTASFIAQYYNERYSEQNEADSKDNMHIVTNVTFNEDGLRVNIIQAPGNASGVLVKVRVEPEEWFPNVLPQKTSIISDGIAVFDEVLQFSMVTKEGAKENENENTGICGALVFQVRTPRLPFSGFLRGTVHHEAIIPLNKIPLADKTELHTIKHERLALTRPKNFTNYKSLMILRSRSHDKLATKFLNLLQSRWSDDIRIVATIQNLSYVTAPHKQ